MLVMYNTLTRRKELFVPLNPQNVRMYVCGMTVYDYCHLGHARVLVVFDMIARWLRQHGYPLTYVRNITDIDDKIIARANENGESIGELTARFIAAMNEDADALGVQRPDIEPKATEYIPQVIVMIEQLIAKGKAYVADNGDVYYSVREFPFYGQFSAKGSEDLYTDNQHKDSSADFVLWKAAKEGEPFWYSLWGKGRPGWHIECSAMSYGIFGSNFDIHGGGIDLQFPHHENEIAQSCALHDGCDLGHSHDSVKSHVKYWLHNGFVNVNNLKMSKSFGNSFKIRDVFKDFHPEVLRFFILRSHYRSSIDYSYDSLVDSRNSLMRLYNATSSVSPSVFDLNTEENEYTKKFYDAMNDDFNTVEAIAVLFELSKAVNKTKSSELSGCLKSLASILGLLENDYNSFSKYSYDFDSISDEELSKLLDMRDKARRDKNWEEADRIRDVLISHGIDVKDSSIS